MRWRRTTFENADGSTWSRPDDGVLLDDQGRDCARVYLRVSHPDGPKWWWGWQRDPAASGYADTKAAAKAECERRAVAQLHCSPICAAVKSGG